MCEIPFLVYVIFMFIGAYWMNIYGKQCVEKYKLKLELEKDNQFSG